MDRRFVAKLFEAPRSFGVELWDGSHLDDAPRTSRIVLRTPRALTYFLPPTSERQLADGFVRGDIDFVGDTIDVVESLARWGGPRIMHLRATDLARTPIAKLRLALPATRLRPFGRRHSKARDARAVRHHYDAPTALFRLFLDSTLTYSCAVFSTPNENLEEAQAAKLELIARKLAIRCGDEVLDIGCGWGSFVEYAVRCGARAIGVTLSERQLRDATARGLPVLMRDYRDLPSGPFDKIASVGMMEHVGRAHLEDYFERAYRCLRPGGLFLNHAIADISPGDPTLTWTTWRRGRFMDGIFPDAELIPVAEVVRVAERAGFELSDVECLREDYALTLRHWLTRFEGRFADAEQLVGHTEARRWRLYLASCAAAFRLGKIGVYQVLLARRDETGASHDATRRRARW